MNREQEIELKLTVTCVGDYTPDMPDYFENGQWYPGDPADAENFKVYLVDPKGYRFEITSCLDADQVEELKNEFLQICDGEELNG